MMFLQRSFLAIALVLVLSATVVAAPNRARGRRSRGSSARYGIEGTVVQVHHDRLHRKAGWIKIRHGRHPGYGNRRGVSARAAVLRRRSASGAQVLTFAVNASTRFQRLSGSGFGNGGRASFNSVRTGELVRIIPGSQHVARLVDVLAGSYNRSRHRHAYGQGLGTGRRLVHHRHPLIGSRVVRRFHPRRIVRVNRPVVRRVVARSVRHPLIEGRVAARQTRHVAATRLVRHAVKHPVKHEVKNHKPTPPKHTRPVKHVPPKHTAPKHTNPPKHPAPKPKPNHPKPANHGHAPAHRKR